MSYIFRYQNLSDDQLKLIDERKAPNTDDGTDDKKWGDKGARITENVLRNTEDAIGLILGDE